MKKLKYLFLGYLAITSLTLFGQAENSLSIQENGTFEIPSTALKEVYLIDISSLELTSFEEAVEFFSEKNTDLVMFRPNADGTTATVFLQISRKPEWSVSDWNNTISNINFLEQ